jgi:hypothetical protein
MLLLGKPSASELLHKKSHIKTDMCNPVTVMPHPFVDLTWTYSTVLILIVKYCYQQAEMPNRNYMQGLV